MTDISPQPRIYDYEAGEPTAASQPFDTKTPPPEPRPAPALEGSQRPLTPPLEPRGRPDQGPKSKAPSLSPDTTASPRSARSHQEYLDSLQPPSGDEIQRLAELQDQRARERKQHTRDLRHKSADIAKTEASAQRDFMESRQHHCIQSTLKQAQTRSSHESSSSSPRSAASAAAAAAAPPAEGVDAATAAADNNALGSLQDTAATLIQRSYRGYRVRREMKGLGLDASTRWTHVIRDAKWQNLTTPRARGSGTTSPGDDDEEGTVGGTGIRPRSSTSAARQNWKKVAAIAMRANGDEDSSHSASESESSSNLEMNENMTEKEKEKMRKRRAKAQAKRRKKAKMMGLQYFLEMVDVKHRYGSNLRQYHAEWKKADTNENFFYWLDYGEGKDFEIEGCPRDRLEREQVRYLSREERQHYLVKVDSEGRLCWAKNGLRLDTTEEWKDSVDGIVPVDDPTPAYAPDIESHSQQHHDPARHPADHDSTSGSDDESDASESELEAARAAKYATPTLDDAKGVKKIKHVSAATIFQRLLRKSVKKNTWIFVADTSFRLYVGIKSSGAFQHSSFLQGSRISAAGLIKIKNGRLSSLSPLSGHYRPPAANFRAFVHSLRDEGVDMSHVSISKSYAVLVGLEAYVKTRRKGKDAVHKATLHRDRILDPEEVARREEAERDKSESAAKERQFLQKEEEEKRGEGLGGGMRFLQRLGFRKKKKQ
ncbi:IQ calmodulin-binding domain-containing protein [Apiospora aurea]|uniref:IQ calmodulin-binding domain-containing protein n=1 Tax=Apiospora aurea TaxID=335848 RepID=A0ABR1QSV3_9PEZI